VGLMVVALAVTPAAVALALALALGLAVVVKVVVVAAVAQVIAQGCPLCIHRPLRPNAHCTVIVIVRSKGMGREQQGQAVLALWRCRFG
jgi:hypothetical protein